ncbi:DUF4129 domain-containing protein [Mycetocola saprophilus]|uniref:DUF4129 domain-containing protein n=1 Tax=Mycetocola saprophilus TaxID=76636 RepID=UPI0005BBC010|nr:DUF4129 domain-containing protein [Mycetocola saprophilus]
MSVRLAEPPLTPDAPEAHDWLSNELTKPEYAAATPNLFDRLVTEFLGWLGRLFSGSIDGPGDWVPVLLLLLLAAAVVAAILIWGRPRLNRARASTTQALFGERDTRSAAEIRAAAARAAAAGNYDLAVLEGYRALCRDLDERTIIVLDPGSTAHQAAGAASRAFPAFGEVLARTANDFDAVRYLSVPATAQQWERIRSTDESLRAQRPVLADMVSEVR